MDFISSKAWEEDGGEKLRMFWGNTECHEDSAAVGLGRQTGTRRVFSSKVHASWRSRWCRTERRGLIFTTPASLKLEGAADKSAVLWTIKITVSPPN